MLPRSPDSEIGVPFASASSERMVSNSGVSIRRCFKTAVLNLSSVLSIRLNVRLSMRNSRKIGRSGRPELCCSSASACISSSEASSGGRPALRSQLETPSSLLWEIISAVSSRVIISAFPESSGSSLSSASRRLTESISGFSAQSAFASCIVSAPIRREVPKSSCSDSMAKRRPVEDSTAEVTHDLY